MRGISQFYAFFWIFYFPTCVAYNDLPGFGYIDELMTVILIGYTLYKKSSQWINNKPWREFFSFLGILFFYVLYSLVLHVNVAEAVWLDFVQQIRPYAVVYCTWILAPKFSKGQRKWMLTVMILTLFSWIVYHPETTDGKVAAEFPVLGQLAICTGMSYYLFSEPTKRNKYIALALVCTGLLAPKMKFLGEVVFFTGILFFLKKKLNFQSSKTIAYVTILVIFTLIFTWTKFEVYYVDGWENEALARPMTYKTSLKILWDYFPFGPGMGTFGTFAASKYYSPLYFDYQLDNIWGLSPDNPMFVADAFYPTLSQFGVVGVILFFIFWKRKWNVISSIQDMRYYRVSLLAAACLFIESTADTSYLSGKGMGYFMLLGICFNANRNIAIDKAVRERRQIIRQKMNDISNTKSNEVTLKV